MVTTVSPYCLQKSVTCSAGCPVSITRTNTAPFAQSFRQQQQQLARSYTNPSVSVRRVSYAQQTSDSAAKPERVEGLYVFLRERGLERLYGAVVSWAQASGAAFLEEVQDNLEEMATALSLEREEKDALLGPPCVSASIQSPTAACPVSEGTKKLVPLKRGMTIDQQPTLCTAHVALDRTRTTPVTRTEVDVAATRVQKAYIPLNAWAVAAPQSAQAASVDMACASSTNVNSPQPNTRGAVTVVGGQGETSGYWKYTQNRQQLVTAANPKLPQDSCSAQDLPPLSHRQQVREGPSFFRMRQWTPPRSRVRAHDMHVVKMKMANPQALDNTPLKAAQAALKAPQPAEDAEAGARSQSQLPSTPSTFQELQSNFLQQHGAQIKREMPGVKLVPAQVGEQVSKRFMNAISTSKSEVLPAYHGTDSANIPAIQQKGLLIPGHGGVTVAHGSAHGVGIYTAALGNSWLSKGFCDSNDMLVCGVADGMADEPAEDPSFASATLAPKVSSQSGTRFHRTTRKHANTPSAAQPQTMGNFTVHKETKEVRHVGGAYVVFNESRVAPLFVAQGIGKTNSADMQNAQLAWLAPGGNTNDPIHGSLHNGGFQLGRDQVQIGDQCLWIPPEDFEEGHDGKRLRHRLTAKARDVDRRSRRDSKLAGDSQRQWQ